MSNEIDVEKHRQFIAHFNSQAGSDVLPKLSNNLLKNGDYRNPNWDWSSLDWKRVERNVFNLQKRIYKATKAGQHRRAKKLAKLLSRSKTTIILSVRRITQDNSGKRSTGVDGKKYKTPKQRKGLVEKVLKDAQSEWVSYKAKLAKRKSIPKANGKLRPLGIPTQEDRVIQNVVKTVIEPRAEAEFESNSYGFRPAISAQDAINDIWNCTSQRPKWCLDADIKGCFGNIDHEFLLSKIDKDWQPLIKKWLKAGYIDDGHLHPTESGTPQGGIISPLLANIVLDKLETDLIAAIREIKGWKTKVRRGQLRVIRYADDFVVLHHEKEVIEKAKELIQKWLNERGLELLEEKTKIVHTTEGFDFLGFNIRHYQNNRIKGNYKKALLETEDGRKRVEKEIVLQITPAKDKVQKHKEHIAEIIGRMKSASQDELIRRLNPAISGWANYYRYVLSSPVYTELDNYLWSKLWRWACRRHLKKRKDWVKERYFTFSRNRSWNFTTKYSKIQWHAHAKAPTGSYVKVQANKSYYDGDTPYWAKRLNKGYGNISPSKAKMLKKQDGKCPVCNGEFRNEDLIEAHHIKARVNDGEDKYFNLALLHRHCHDQLHAVDTNSVNKEKNKGLLGRIKARVFGGKPK